MLTIRFNCVIRFTDGHCCSNNKLCIATNAWLVIYDHLILNRLRWVRWNFPFLIAILKWKKTPQMTAKTVCLNCIWCTTNLKPINRQLRLKNWNDQLSLLRIRLKIGVISYQNGKITKQQPNWLGWLFMTILF